MRFRSRACLSTPLILAGIALSAAAHAACDISGGDKIFLGDGGDHELTMQIDRGSSCPLAFRSLDAAVRFDSITISATPKNGRLQKTADTAFTYIAPKRDTADHFSITACGMDTHGKGCNVLNYKVVVTRP